MHIVLLAKSMSIVQVIKEELAEMKWRVLVIACFLTFGSYYIYDFPGSIGTGPSKTIQSRFLANGKAYNQEMNQALYSVYSYPNTVLAVLGGILIDRFLGLRRAMLLFATLVMVGSVIFCIGTVTTTYWLLIVGRVIFGLGGESLSVSQSAFVARWFRGGRGMALAFGITISFSRVGSSFNFLFSPMLATRFGINGAVVGGVVACGVSVFSALILIAADLYAEKVGYIKPEPIQNKEKDADTKVLNLRSICEIPASLWVICVICVACYCSIFPFVGIGKNFFEVKYDLSQDTAASYMSLYMFVSAGCSPLIGFVVDATGRNTLWLIAASSCFFGLHMLLLLTALPPPAAMSMMGLFYSFLVSGLWPSVPLVVEEHVSGFSYGLMTALQNLGLATFPLITGGILDYYTPSDAIGTNSTNSSMWSWDLLNSNVTVPTDPPNPLPTIEGFRITEGVFMIASGVSIVASIVLLLVDLRRSGILTMSSAARKLAKEQKDANREVSPLIA